MAMKVKSLISQKFFCNTFKPIKEFSDVAEIALMSSPLLGLALIFLGAPLCLLISIGALLLIPFAVVIGLICDVFNTLFSLLTLDLLKAIKYAFLIFLKPVILTGLLLAVACLSLLAAAAILLVGAVDAVASLIALPVQLVTRIGATLLSNGDDYYSDNNADDSCISCLSP